MTGKRRACERQTCLGGSAGSPRDLTNTRSHGPRPGGSVPCATGRSSLNRQSRRPVIVYRPLNTVMISAGLRYGRTRCSDRGPESHRQRCRRRRCRRRSNRQVVDGYRRASHHAIIGVGRSSTTAGSPIVNDVEIRAAGAVRNERQFGHQGVGNRDVRRRRSAAILDRNRVLNDRTGDGRASTDNGIGLRHADLGIFYNETVNRNPHA